jgi:sigma-B regulation protein RsbU (phosphoserine phosphatase)
MLFPPVPQAQLDKVNIAGFSRSAAQCGGDWWWYEMWDQTRLRVFVGDVTGHGAGPAMITSFVAGCFGLFKKMNLQMEMPEFLETLNSLLYNVTKGDYLVSAVSLEINIETGKVSVLNSGSPGVFIVRQKGEIESVSDIGTLLGGEEFEVNSVEIQLGHGDRIYIPTDGVMEMPLPGGRALGIRKTLKIIEKTRDVPIDQCLTFIMGELDQERGPQLQDDDITMVYLELK